MVVRTLPVPTLASTVLCTPAGEGEREGWSGGEGVVTSAREQRAWLPSLDVTGIYSPVALNPPPPSPSARRPCGPRGSVLASAARSRVALALELSQFGRDAARVRGMDHLARARIPISSDDGELRRRENSGGFGPMRRLNHPTNSAAAFVARQCTTARARFTSSAINY